MKQAFLLPNIFFLGILYSFDFPIPVLTLPALPVLKDEVGYPPFSFPAPTQAPFEENRSLSPAV